MSEPNEGFQLNRAAFCYRDVRRNERRASAGQADGRKPAFSQQRFPTAHQDCREARDAHRVVPNFVFVQGMGDLFVTRVVGNYPDDLVTGSIEYAIEHLGSRLVMVLGHENCGAVAATSRENRGSDQARHRGRRSGKRFAP